MADDTNAAVAIPDRAAGQAVVVETGSAMIEHSPVAGLEVGPLGELTLASPQGVIAVYAPGRWWHVRVVEQPEGMDHG